MWDHFHKALMLLPISVVTVIVANIIPYMTYRQNGEKNRVALMDTLARELNKNYPSAYLVEHCVARLHNIRPLPWEFLRVVLPCSHSLEIIQQLSSGRRLLDLFDISVINDRPVVKYAAALNTVFRRRSTMFVCFLLSAFFTGLMLHTEWLLIGLVSEHSWQNSVSDVVFGDVLYKVVQMLVYAAAIMIFTGQGMILKLADKRLKRIKSLISSNFQLAGSAETNSSATES